MASAVKLAVTQSSEGIAMAWPVGRSPLAQRPSPAQIECNHACARFADVVSSRVGARRDGGGSRHRRLDHLPHAAGAAGADGGRRRSGGGRCTAVMARCLRGSDMSTRAPLGAGRRAPSAIALNIFSSTLPLTAFGGRRTSRNKLWSFRSLSESYDRKGSGEDRELEAFAARCYSSQCWRCSRMTSTSPQPQMLHRSRRRSLSQCRRLGRMGTGGGRSTGERGVMTVAFKKSGEGEGGKEHEQGEKSLPSPPSMFSVKQLLGGGKVGEPKLMAASSRDAAERSVDIGVGPGADSGAASLSSSSSPLRFSSSKSFQLAAGMVQAAIVGGVLNGLDPILLIVAALAGIAEVLVENKDVQNLLENLATKNSRQRFSNSIELQRIVRKLENILDAGKQEGKLDLSLLDESDQQILRSVLFLLREDERDLPEVSPTDSISTEGSPTAVRTDKSGTGTDLSSLVKQLAPMTGLKAPWENGDSTASLRDNSSSSLPPKFTAVNSQQKREWRSYLMPYVANALIDLPPMQMPQLFGKAAIAGGLRAKELLMDPIAPSENDLQAFNLGEDAVTEWANYVNAVPREKIYIPLTISNNVTFKKPFRVVVYGQPLVLFRPSPGEIAALPDACPHRGASLSMGVLVMNNHASSHCVRCPYHGLEFSSEGKCQKPNIHLNPVKVVETNGIVWIEEQPLTLEDAMDLGEELAPFLQTAEEMVGVGVIKDALQEEDVVSSGEKQTKINGQDPFADAPFGAHFRMPGYAVTQGTVEIKAPPKAVVDNTFDLHHMHHVHATTFGGGQLLETLQPNPNTICFRYGMRRSNPMRPFFGNGCVQVKMERFPPYSALITVGDAQGKVQVKTMSHVVPTSATTSTLVWQLLRNICTPTVFNPIFDIAVRRILSEDQVVLEGVDFQGIRKGMDLGT